MKFLIVTVDKMVTINVVSFTYPSYYYWPPFPQEIKFFNGVEIYGTF